MGLQHRRWTSNFAWRCWSTVQRGCSSSENLQREDVTPLEEAAGYQALIDEHNETAERIAEQVGKSRSYVYGRLKLLELCPQVRRSLEAGDVDAEAALLIARLRLPKLQEKALNAIKGRYLNLEDGGKESFRRIRSLLNEHFTLTLKNAPFPIEDEMLVPLAGNCVRCVKRSANAPEYEDLASAKETDDRWRHRNKGPDVCTDPECFASKKAAQQLRDAEALRLKGETVIGGAKARQLVDAQGHVKGGFIALKDVKADLQAAVKKAKAEGTPAPQVVTIQNPRDGKTFKAVTFTDLQAAGVDVNVPPSTHRGVNAADQARQAKERAEREKKAEAETTVRHVVLDRTLEAMRTQPRTVVELLWMAMKCFNGTDWDARDALAKRHGVKHADQLEKHLGQWSADRLALFAVECLLIEDATVQSYELDRNKGERLFQSAKHYGVDVASIRAGASALITPPSAARAAKGAGGKAKAGAGARKAIAHAAADAGQLLLEEPGSAGHEQTDDGGCAAERATEEASS
jgi:ParB-like chromosome segregation protein Spo0J